VFPATGAHVLAQHNIVGNGILTTAGITTQSAGSSIIVSVGRGDIDLLGLPTDNKANSPYFQLGPSIAYPVYTTSGAALYTFLNAKGGTGDIFTPANSAGDEVTIVVVEVKNGLVVVDSKGAVATSGLLTSPSVTTTGPASIVAFCWGNYAGGVTKVSVNNSFAVLDMYGGTDTVSVQSASASLDVQQAGTYNVTWTLSPPQSAILFIVALQAEAAKSH
jgi:hypothetical protein